MKPKDPALMNDLGFAYLEDGNLERAEEEFRAALAINPNDRRSINNLGLCVGMDGRYEEAYTLFRRVGSDAEAQANIGYILAQRGNINDAMQRYSRALTLNPELKTAAEALVQLTSLSQAADSTETRIASGQSASASPPIQQVSASEIFEEPPPSSKAASPTLGLSAP